MDTTPLWKQATEIITSPMSGRSELEKCIRLYFEIIDQETELNQKAIAYNNIGIAHNALGNPEQAILNFESALILDPSDSIAIGAYINRGYSYLKRRMYQETIDDLTRALEYRSILEENRISALRNRGLAHLKIGNYQDTVNDLSIVVKNDEEDMSSLIHLGDAYLGVSNTRKAIKSFRTTVDIFEAIPLEKVTAEDWVEHRRVKTRLDILAVDGII